MKNINKIAEECGGCGLCLKDCDISQKIPSLNLNEIALQALSGCVSEETRQYIMRCGLCGLCTQDCPNKLDKTGMIIAIRNVLLKGGVTDPEIFRVMWVDHDWNAITLYRDTYQLDFSNLIKERCETLFLPSCSLANRAPQLVNSTNNWLTDRKEGEVGLTLMCCGVPLREMGMLERAEKYTEMFWQQVRSMGASRVVTVCPACHNYLLNHKPGYNIEIISVFELMASAGVSAPILGSGRITIHDSCPTRGGEMGKWVRSILGNYEIVEMAHHGVNSICCGSGGAISMVDPELHDNRAIRRVKEFHDTGSDICVTYCMACSNTLSSVAQQGTVRHILEIVFNELVDHEEYAAKLRMMWEGEWGKYNEYRLNNSRPLDKLTI